MTECRMSEQARLLVRISVFVLLIMSGMTGIVWGLEQPPQLSPREIHLLQKAKKAAARGDVRQAQTNWQKLRVTRPSTPEPSWVRHPELLTPRKPVPATTSEGIPLEQSEPVSWLEYMALLFVTIAVVWQIRALLRDIRATSR